MSLEYEIEAEGELEWEVEGEGEEEVEGEGEWAAEGEGEAESEEFFRQVAALARRAAASPALRRAGLAAARGALSGLGGAIGRQVSGWLPQQETEMEMEMELEGDWEVNPIRRIYPEALMEHLGHAAAAAESEAEAEAFLGALVPLAARLLPRAASTVMRVAPNLIRGIAGAARTLRRNPATRPLVRALPAVVRRTTATLARQASRGRPVTPQSAVRTLARQTAQVLGSPRQCAQVYRRSRALDRRYHQTAGPAASATGAARVRPTGLCPGCRRAAAGGVN